MPQFYHPSYPLATRLDNRARRKSPVLLAFHICRDTISLMNRGWRDPIGFLVLALLLALAFGAGYLAAPLHRTSSFPLLEEAWQALSQDYVEPQALDQAKLEQGAIRGLVEALQDPYTHYLDPQHLQWEEAYLEGKFEGIGAEVTQRDSEFIVLTPLPGSPAEKAGIRPGDRILQVDGEPTTGLTLLELISRIRGPKGTAVRLLILPEGQVSPAAVEVVREEISEKSVTLTQKDRVAVIRIASVSSQTPEELKEALSQLPPETGALVLDLRSNPGGLLDEVIEVAGQFIEKDAIVAYEVDSRGEKTAFKAPGDGLALRYPLAILVDRFTASAGEVLAAALRDNKGAPLFGSRTFGKGSVNVLQPLSDGSALIVTTSRWVSPLGHAIEGQGLEPDYPIEPAPGAEGGDPVLEAALKYLEEKAQ